MAEDTADLFSRASAKIGRRIVELRQQHRLKQKKLGDELGCTSSHISHVESGKAELSLSQIAKLASLFHVDPLELITGLPPEACKVVDEIAALSPDRRLAAVRLFRSTTEMAEAVTMWQTRSTE